MSSEFPSWDCGLSCSDIVKLYYIDTLRATLGFFFCGTWIRFSCGKSREMTLGHFLLVHLNQKLKFLDIKNIKILILRDLDSNQDDSFQRAASYH